MPKQLLETKLNFMNTEECAKLGSVSGVDVNIEVKNFILHDLDNYVSNFL